MQTCGSVLHCGNGYSYPKVLLMDTASSALPGRYKNWTEEDMEKALKGVVVNNESIRRAALDYKVPKSTLGDRVHGRVQPGSRSGPERLLSDAEEAELVAFVRRCSVVGYPKTRKDVIGLVQRIAESRGIDWQISNGWWEKFCA